MYGGMFSIFVGVVVYAFARHEITRQECSRDASCSKTSAELEKSGPTVADFMVALFLLMGSALFDGLVFVLAEKFSNDKGKDEIPGPLLSAM